MPTTVQDLEHVLTLLAAQPRVPLQQLGEAEDGVHRRAQLMAHQGQEFGLGLIRALRLLLGLAQIGLDLDTHGHVQMTDHDPLGLHVLSPQGGHAHPMDLVEETPGDHDPGLEAIASPGEHVADPLDQDAGVAMSGALGPIAGGEIVVALVETPWTPAQPLSITTPGLVDRLNPPGRVDHTDHGTQGIDDRSHLPVDTRLERERLLQLGDVLLDTDEMGDGVGLITHRREGQPVPEQGSVLAVIAKQHASLVAERKGRAQFVDARLIGIPILQKATIPPQDLGRRIAGQGEKRRIDVAQRLIRLPGIDHRHPARHGFDDLGLPTRPRLELGLHARSPHRPRPRDRTLPRVPRPASRA